MMKANLIQPIPAPMSSRPVRQSNRSRGVAIVLVIVAVAVAAVIGSAYVASQLNAPQIIGNVNDGIEARSIADSGADLATAIMECETIEWRTAAASGTLMADVPMGNGTVSITVKNANGDNPDSTTQYPIIVSRGKSGAMKQTVGMQVHAPLPAKINGGVDVDLSEFAAFGNTSIYDASGWIAQWPASPRAGVGLPVRVGTNSTANDAIAIKNASAAPDAIGYVMTTAPHRVISDTKGGPAPIDRVDFSTNETIPLPAAPTPDFSGLKWAMFKTPNITSDTTSAVNTDSRLNSLTVDNRATLTIDLAGGNRTVGISGPLLVHNQGVMQINNGHLDLIVTGNFTMSGRSAIALGPGASLTLWLGGTVSVDDSVLGLPTSVRDLARDARTGLDTYYDPSLCTLYRITSITSLDLNLLDFDNAADWNWSNNSIESWIFTNAAYVCGRLYGPTKVSFAIDGRSAIFGNVVANTIDISNESAIYYDHTLDSGCGYTNPTSALYAAPLDLRDDVRLLLTDLNDSTLASILALVNVTPSPVPFDPFGPTPRDRERVAKRWWKRYGVPLKHDRDTNVDTVVSAEAN